MNGRHLANSSRTMNSTRFSAGQPGTRNVARQDRPGGDFLGWVTVIMMKNSPASKRRGKIQSDSVLVVIGIGGSYSPAPPLKR
ncbi:MAG: hypothetical protein ACLR7U_00615 [Ruthenibacterium lactatiformans]